MRAAFTITIMLILGVGASHAHAAEAIAPVELQPPAAIELAPPTLAPIVPVELPPVAAVEAGPALPYISADSQGVPLSAPAAVESAPTAAHEVLTPVAVAVLEAATPVWTPVPHRAGSRPQDYNPAVY